MHMPLRAASALLMSIVVIGSVYPNVVMADNSARVQPEDLIGSANRSSVTVFDVGQGSCAMISCTNGDEILVDCGSRKMPYNGYKDDIKKYIRGMLTKEIEPAQGGYITSVRKLRSIFVSHGDSDHYNLIPQVLPEDVEIGGIYLGGQESDYGKNSGKFRKWLTKQSEKGVHVHSAPDPNEFYYDAAPEPEYGCYRNDDQVVEGLQILGMNRQTNKGNPKNNKSIVLAYELRVAGTLYRAIFPGDAEVEEETAILEAFKGADPDPLDASLLVPSHHGSLTSSDTSWLGRINPQYAIFSAGKKGNYHHPRCVTVNAVENVPNSDLGQKMRNHDLTCWLRKGNGKKNGEWDTQNYTDAVYSTHDSGMFFTINYLATDHSGATNLKTRVYQQYRADPARDIFK